MKKSLLTGTLLGVCILALGQNAKVNVTTPLSKKNAPHVRANAFKGDEMPAATKSTTKTANAKQTPTVNTVAGTTIGETQYDLQSNAAMGRRIINHGNGTLSAIWTICPQASPYTPRGTGYNFYDGTKWIYPDTTNPVVVNRLETVRTGFPSIGRLGTNKDIIMNHETAGYSLMRGSNPTTGAMPFSFFGTSATVALAGKGAIWPRIAVGGPGDTSIHVVANYSDTLAIVAGVKQPMVYSRSQDAGATWDITAIALPGMDSTSTLYGSADAYDIDAVGNNVGIVMGGLGEHVTLWKSTDNGTTFTRTLVDNFIYAPDYTTSPLMTVGNDSAWTNDGSVSVLLDPNGKAHVAFARSQVGLDATGASVFRPGTIGLAYWNEITQTQVDIPISLAAVDADLSGTYDIGTGTTDNAAARPGNSSLLCQTTIGMDAAGNIFITFSLPADADLTPDDQNFRDIWAVASWDGGATWSEAMNLTQTGGVEEIFPTMAKLVDNYLHIVYQEDAEPGTALTNTDPDGLNNIGYLRVDKNLFQVGIKEQNKASFAVGQNYPNPHQGLTTFGVSLVKSAEMSVSVTNMYGQEVLAKRTGMLSPGMHNISLDCTNLSAGIYFYTVKSNGESVTKKMIVE